MPETQTARQSGEYRLAPEAITVGQAAAYFELHVRLGFADAAEELAAPEKRAGPSTWAEGRPEPAARVQIALGPFLAAVVREDALPELAEIIFGLGAGEGVRVPIAAVREALGPFAVACWQLIAELAGIERGMASA